MRDELRERIPGEPSLLSKGSSDHSGAPSNRGAVQLKAALVGKSFEEQEAMLAPGRESAAPQSNAPPVQLMGSGGTPKNNQDQNRQFQDALREIERRIGRKVTPDMRRTLHDSISGQNFGYHEIVEEGVNLFGADQ